MKRGLIIVAAVLLLIAPLALACGGSGGSGSGNGNGSTVTAGTTSDDFEQLRDSVVRELDSIGVNIGFVPDDVLGQIIYRCRQLTQFADERRVNQLCDVIQRARDNNDPGSIDQIVAQLRQLQRK